MDTAQKSTATPGGNHIVYIRSVKVADLPQEVQDQTQGAHQVYAVHAANGDRLALVGDRKMAFVLARQNDMVPVHVH